ncbi:hypothetical protein [Pedobacter agri]|uniref:Uncharacterized protein n=1 Tax=Pedobacter agri TaxID=454586 RepID=A0A9X3DGQ1_9SPHI|nr:hypothetical protein [Pedobacter agri]MCX3267473.1 hypothetical protein [Pedobacter agri]RYD98107.1 MAG: hypothetical protein EOP54_08735 [Sphingobacteriales bacterium]
MENSPQDFKMGFLNTPISKLPVTEVFMLRSKLMGFSNLAEIVQTDLVKLSKHEDYSQRWYLELINVLGRHGLLHLIAR